MAHAMHDFAHNWTYHRHKLLDKIQAMGEMAETTMTTFKTWTRSSPRGRGRGGEK